MKSLTLTITILISFICSSQITYVDNFDGVYPFTQSTMVYNFDLNGDLQNDCSLNFGIWNGSCFNGASSGPSVRFKGLTNSFGQNLVNGNGSQSLGIDCTNDTLNILDVWNTQSMLYVGFMPWDGYCFNMGVGTHKQGFRLIMTNPANGSLGYKYGYIDYSIGSNGDIIIHGWYYENTFNVPIAANSLLDYPYDGNCIVYDTISVYDTVTVYDTVFVSVTDTLFVETTLSTNPLSQNTIKVFPNPTSNFLTINTGNFALMTNYTLRIENNSGQTVFTGLVNQPEYILDLSNWTGNGIYYLHLIDDQNNTLTIRKIVLD